MSEADALQQEINRLLAAALTSDARHVAARERATAHQAAATDRAESDHRAAMKHLEEEHLVELLRQRMAHDDEVAGLHAALVNRDVIGQAKGIIIAAMHCSADDAFALLVRQSQHENRKIVEIAQEISQRAQRLHGPDAGS